MKWTKFKDGKPKVCPFTGSNVYLTNWEVVWTAWLPELKSTWETYANNYPEYAWAEIELPEVPKEERIRHLCIQNERVSCFELSDGSLCLEKKDLVCCGGRTAVEVTICPFCGYSPKEDK